MPRSRSRTPPLKRDRRRSRSRSRERRHRKKRSRSRSPRHRSPAPRHKTRSISPRRRLDRSLSPHKRSKDREKDPNKTLNANEIIEIDESKMEGLDEEQMSMMKLMGFAGFNTTKGKKVEGNDVSGVQLQRKRRYRQYMNRRGGFNRPLDFVAWGWSFVVVMFDEYTVVIFDEWSLCECVCEFWMFLFANAGAWNPFVSWWDSDNNDEYWINDIVYHCWFFFKCV